MSPDRGTYDDPTKSVTGGASAMAKPKIAVIGKGHVGSAIGQGAQRAGYSVRTTGHDPAAVREAAAWGDIIVLAVPGPAREATVKELGDVTGKTIVGPTNLIGPNFSYGGDLRKSGAEQVQDWAKGAHVVKAFNTNFAETMATGKAHGETIALFVAGDDAGAKKQILDLGRDLGHQAVDAGPLQNARLLEVFGFLNIQLGMGPSRYGRDIGFRVVGIPAP